MVRTAGPQKLPRILESAARLFAGRTFHEVRMEDIAARAGVAKGTLDRHFKDKDALFSGGAREADRWGGPGGEEVWILSREMVAFSGGIPTISR